MWRTFTVPWSALLKVDGFLRVLLFLPSKNLLSGYLCLLSIPWQFTFSSLTINIFAIKQPRSYSFSSAQRLIFWQVFTVSNQDKTFSYKSCLLYKVLQSYLSHIYILNNFLSVLGQFVYHINKTYGLFQSLILILSSHCYNGWLIMIYDNTGCWPWPLPDVCSSWWAL